MDFEQINALQKRYDAILPSKDYFEGIRQAYASITPNAEYLESIRTAYSNIALSQTNFTPLLAGINSTNRLHYTPTMHFSDSLAEFSKTFRAISEAFYAPIVQFGRIVADIYESIRAFFEALAYPFIRFSQIVNDLAALVSPIIRDYATSWNRIRSMNLSQVLETLSAIYPEEIGNDWESDNDVATLTIQEQEEIVGITELIATQPENWQARLMEWYEKWAKQNPVIAKLLTKYILPVFIAVTATMAVTSISATRSATLLREEPMRNAPVITTIIENKNVFIVDSVPYWHEVEYEDVDTGEIYSGWIPKRSITYSEYSSYQEDESSTDSQEDVESVITSEHEGDK